MYQFHADYVLLEYVSYLKWYDTGKRFGICGLQLT